MSHVSHIRPGFVYAATRALDPNWVKVGYTRRAPTHRVTQLANASHRESFVLLDARFVWDASQAERHIHQSLAQSCRHVKEFFQASPDLVSGHLDAAENADALRAPPHKSRRWSSSDDLPADWMTDQCAQWQQAVKKGGRSSRQALSAWERASAKGDPIASLGLAEHIMENGMPSPQWATAQWLFAAAVKQGDSTASIRQALWHSRADSQAQTAWWDICLAAHDILISDGAIPQHMHDALLDEQSSWAHSPDRARAWAAHHASRHHDSATSAASVVCRP